MRSLWLAAAFFAASGVVWAVPPEYRERRAALSNTLKDGVVVLFGRTDQETEDDRAGFFQEPNFLYLTGWREAGAILLLSPGADMLFIPDPDARHERYMGPTLKPDDASAPAATGFQTVLPVERFEGELRRALEGQPRLYTAGEAAEERLGRLEPLRKVASGAGAIANMRMKKSAAELESIRQSIDASIAAHRAAWKRAAAGLYEYQVAAIMVETYAQRGCERSAYAPIVAAGPNAVVLHYSKNKRRMDKGDLLLMDVGAECSDYAADITRTIPVGAPFTARQRELYEVVLGAEKAAIAAVRPGVTLAELTKAGRAYMDAHGKDLHGEPLGKYFTHGITHHVGLEVHDASDTSAPLAERMVITIEPGLYIPEEHIGIRIEDMVLVTKEGGEIMTAALPREPGEIEKALGK
jgi:Xaa-Pro aminopeptidase